MQNRNLRIVRRLTNQDIKPYGRIKMSMSGLDRIMDEARKEAVEEYRRDNEQGWKPSGKVTEDQIKRLRSKSVLDYFRLF